MKKNCKHLKIGTLKFLRTIKNHEWERCWKSMKSNDENKKKWKLSKFILKNL